jgi:hypothetical protein
MHLFVLLVWWSCSDHYVDDYHFSSRLSWRDSFPTTLQYFDTLLIIPVMKNRLKTNKRARNKMYVDLILKIGKVLI